MTLYAFWTGVLTLSVVGIVYPSVIYPALLTVLPRLRRRDELSKARVSRIAGFSIIIPAHNEERVIEDKLRTTLEAARQSGYPWQVIVAADGCTDRTCELVRQFEPDVELVIVQERGGIVGAFKAGLPAARYEVVVFSDADIRVDRDNYRMLVRHFAAPDVGGACGATRMYVTPQSALHLEQLNVFLRTWVRRRQSEHCTTVGADGANWAIRKHLISWPLNPQMAEDLVVPLQVVRQGFRFVFDPEAGALETSPGAVVDEYHRKVRTIAGGIQAGWYCRWMFAAPHRWVGFHYASWKLAKYLVAWWMLLALVSVLSLSVYSRVAAVASVIAVAGLVVGGLGGFAGQYLPGPARHAFQAVWYAMVTLSTPFAAVALLLSKRATTLWRMAPR
jgi:cellulose synthase/poly-beta-1,6-N-acetylglucosamine synthase-like glycosyltransferase